MEYCKLFALVTAMLLSGFPAVTNASPIAQEHSRKAKLGTSRRVDLHSVTKQVYARTQEQRPGSLLKRFKLEEANLVGARDSSASELVGSVLDSPAEMMGEPIADAPSASAQQAATRAEPVVAPLDKVASDLQPTIAAGGAVGTGVRTEERPSADRDSATSTTETKPAKSRLRQVLLEPQFGEHARPESESSVVESNVETVQPSSVRGPISILNPNGSAPAESVSVASSVVESPMKPRSPLRVNHPPTRAAVLSSNRGSDSLAPKSSRLGPGHPAMRRSSARADTVSVENPEPVPNQTVQSEDSQSSPSEPAEFHFHDTERFGLSGINVTDQTPLPAQVSAPINMNFSGTSMQEDELEDLDLDEDDEAQAKAEAEANLRRQRANYRQMLKRPMAFAPAQMTLSYFDDDGKAIDQAEQKQNWVYHFAGYRGAPVVMGGWRIDQFGNPWMPACAVWKSPDLCYGPLYFEETNLERFGGRYPGFQSAISAVHFFGNVMTLPYQAARKPPCRCYYAVGHGRPGNRYCYQMRRPVWSLEAGSFQALLVTGLAFALP